VGAEQKAKLNKPYAKQGYDMANAYLKAALVTIAITLLGFFFISQLDSMRADELKDSVNDLVFQSESERMLYLYAQVMGNDTGELCSYISGTEKTKASRTYELSEKIRYYERSNLMNAEYERIRNQYYLSNAALYLNTRAAEKYCGQSPYTTVLFFYKVKGDCPECRTQGGALDELGAKYPKLRVFAFPADTEHEFINVFLARHNITTVPAVVIDDNVVLEGLQSKQELEKYIG